MKFDFASLQEKAFENDWPVNVQVPQEGGKTQEQTFMVRFRFVPEEELQALGDGVEGAKASLREVVAGFGKGEEEEFSEELFELMLTRPYVRLALNKAYGEFVLGVAAKNSVRPRA